MSFKSFSTEATETKSEKPGKTASATAAEQTVKKPAVEAGDKKS